MDQMWRGANVEKASPRMTIKGRESAAPSDKSTLVIQPRQFRDTKGAVTARPSDADYDLIKMLGQGGMGVVYWARQASIDRNVAVKMLKPEMARDGAQRNKFLAEAVITGDLDHPNIVPIYELGKNPEGALFYAMKKVQGTPWDRALPVKSQPENLEILMKVADAVAFAHSRFVVHRDLKPENVMLGDYGEVLVMDWGLALPFRKFEKSRSIQPSVSMGGTPAYMAPEMATGPFQKIAPTSDVYLLGAILYEIVTGKPPHTGRDVMKCLFAAAKNEIQSTEVTGELVNIALKSMSTQQADRYQSVQEFQQAIRDYEAHSASIAMATRAAETLAAAEQSNNYDHFATAVFEFQEALKLWSGNATAAKGVPASKLAYASSALHKGDLDLAESLLDPEEATHTKCLAGIEAAKQEREAKQQRLKAARRAVRGLAAAVFLAVTTGLVAVGYQTIQVSRQRDLAVSNEKRAQEQEKLAKTNEQTALTNAEEARKQKTKAEVNALEAQRQETLAKENAAEAVRNAQIADSNAKRAEMNAIEAKRQETIAVENANEAKRQQEIAEYEAYVALIGLAAAKIEENAFGYARDLLDQCRPELRNWEWGRLMHLCQQSVRDFDSGAPIDAIAVSPDGKRFVTGGWNGMAQIWNVADGSLVASLPQSGSYVYTVAFSPDGKYLATGGSDRSGYLRIWSAATGEPVRALTGHTDGVLSVTFSPNGNQLLSTSYDNSARLWDVETGRLIRTYEGHSWWVWDADFSPDGRQIVTVSQDGTALVWSTESGQHGPPFMGHQGPVYSASFSADGQFVVTGGYDRRVLRWRPADVTPFDYRALVATGETTAPKYQEFTGHLAAVRSVAFSRDGKLLVSGGHDNTVRIWNPESGDLVKTLRGHDSWVRACTFLPDGQSVLSAGHDNHARLWDIEGYAESRVLQGKWLRGHDDAIMAVAFSPTGDQIVTASRDRTAKAWNAKTGAVTARFEEGHSFLASSAAFSPDGQRLYTAAVDGTTRGWDVTSGVQKIRLDGTGLAAALAISHNGRWLLTGGNRLGLETWRAQLWDAATGNRLFELAGHASEVTAVAFSPDDQFCYTGDANGRGVLWETRSGRQIRQLQWHTSKIAAAVFLQDGSRLLTASDDKTVGQWNTSTLATNPAAIAVNTQWTLKHSESVLSLDVVADKNLAITCTLGGDVTLWNIAAATPIRTLAVGKTNVNAVALSRDGRKALTVHPDNEERLVRLWDVASGREMQVPTASGQPGPFLDLKESGGLVWSAFFSHQGDTVVTIGGNEARVWDTRAEMPGKQELMSFSPHAAVASASYSHDGMRVVTGSWDNSARIWDAATGKGMLKLVGGHDGYVNSAVFSPDDRLVLTASDDKTAKLWDAQTGQLVRSFEGHRAGVRCAIFSEKGDQILTGSDDKTARIWDVETGAVIREFTGHEWGVLHAAFAPDGSRIITGSDDNTAIIWDAATGQVQWTLAGHTAAVTAVAFAPDGKRVLTASEDFTAKLWDTENGKEVLNLKGHTQELTSIAFSPDGRYALTGSRDGTAILWLTTSWESVPAAK
jgi:WD40 repeat protein